MFNYDSDDQLTAVGQSCRRFRSGGSLGRRANAASEGISCGACKNWDGSRCLTNAYDNVLISIDQ